MNKQIIITLVVVLLLNVTVSLVGFCYLDNKINQLNNEQTVKPITPSSTKPDVQKIPEQTQASSETDVNEEKEVAENNENNLTPTYSRDKIYLPPKPEYQGETPEVKFSIVSYRFEGMLKGYVVNPNYFPLYNVSIKVIMSLGEFRMTMFLGYASDWKIVDIGTMEANEKIRFDQEFWTFKDPINSFDLLDYRYEVTFYKTEQ